VIRHFTASGIVLDHDQVLLVKHRKLGLWLYPGGHIDPDEDPAQTVMREIGEEAGIDVEIIGKTSFAHPAVGAVPVPFTILVEDVTDPTVGPHQHIDMVYVCRPRSVEVTVQLGELDGHTWVPLADIALLRTPPELPSLVASAAKYVASHDRS
jgi:8-oxo-dGTP diphosphatase